MTSVNDPTPSTSKHICSRSGCNMEYTVTENYHNCVNHQETMQIKIKDVTHTLRRNSQSREFVCLTCPTGYVDPERLRVHFLKKICCITI